MDPRLQTSFIPKNPLVEGGRRSASGPRTVSIFFLGSMSVFIVSLSIFAFFFFFNMYIEKDIESKNAQLRKDMDFPANTVNELARLDLRIKTSEDILKNHIASSAIFKLFESLTTKKTQLTRMQYTGEGGNIRVSLAGISSTINALAFQSDLVRANNSILGPIFSDIHTDDKGNEGFTLDATLQASLVSYMNNVGGNASTTLINQ